MLQTENAGEPGQAAAAGQTFSLALRMGWTLATDLPHLPTGLTTKSDEFKDAGGEIYS